MHLSPFICPESICPFSTAYGLPFPTFALVSASAMVEGEIKTFAPVIPW